jgi:protein-S-isoprenylcysteine O-methyltransferase Ste14
MSQKPRVALLISGGLIVVGVGLLFFYQLTGSYVDEQGWLVEPFWALALGTMSVFVGSLLMVLTLLAVVFGSVVRRRNTDDQGSTN